MRDNIIFVKKSVKTCTYVCICGELRPTLAPVPVRRGVMFWTAAHVTGFPKEGTSVESLNGLHLGFAKPASGLKKPLRTPAALMEPQPLTLLRWSYREDRSSPQLSGVICYPLLRALNNWTSWRLKPEWAEQISSRAIFHKKKKKKIRLFCISWMNKLNFNNMHKHLLYLPNVRFCWGRKAPPTPLLLLIPFITVLLHHSCYLLSLCSRQHH